MPTVGPAAATIQAASAAVADGVIAGRAPGLAPQTTSDQAARRNGLGKPPAASHALSYRPDIDGLRAVAVVPVVLFHAFPGYMPGGFTGVDIFFVISGYLISLIVLEGLLRGHFSLLDFYSRRVRRIFPAMLTMLAATAGFSWWIATTDEWLQLQKHVLGSAIFSSNIMLYMESGYFDVAAESKPLLHFWSLAVEEQFYLFWPLLLWAFRYQAGSFLRVTAILGLSSLALGMYLVQADRSAAYYWPLPRFWELMAGGVLAYMVLHRPQQLQTQWPAAANLQSGLGALLLVAGFYVVDKERAFPGLWAVLPVVGTFLVIAAGPTAWINRYVLSHRILVTIGLISYPLYLWHWPVLAFARILDSDKPTAGARIVAVLLAFALAAATYWLLELPLRKARVSNRVKVGGLLALMLAITGIVWISDRSTAVDKQLYSTTMLRNDFGVPYRESCAPLMGSKFSNDWCHLSEAGPAGSLDQAQVLVIGDSHAGSFSTVMSALRQHDDFYFAQLARGQCPTLLNYGPPSCQALAAKALEYAKSLKGLKTVVLAGRWPMYEDRFEPDMLDNTKADFTAALRRTLSAYQALGVQLVVIHDVPLTSNPKACVERPIAPLSEFAHLQACPIPLSRAQEADLSNRQIFKALARDYPQLQFFDPWHYLCDKRECRVRVGDDILYVDESHLSVSGGAYLARQGGDALRTMIGLR